MVSRTVLHLTNLASILMPQTRMFHAKARFYAKAGVKLGRNVKICGSARIHDPHVTIGDGTWVGAGVQLISTSTAPIEIGARCDIGPEVMVVVGSHLVGKHERRGGSGDSKPIRIGSGCWIGARALFVAGSSIGDGCIVAAGAVVTKNFGNDVLIAGVPARIVKDL